MSTKTSHSHSPYVASEEFTHRLWSTSQKAAKLQELLKPEEDLVSLPDEIQQRHQAIQALSSRLFDACGYDRLGGRESGSYEIKTHEQELNYVAQVLSHLSVARALADAYQPYAQPPGGYCPPHAGFDPNNHFHNESEFTNAKSFTASLIAQLRDTEKCLKTNYST